jgi:hypothetical protein
MKNIVKIKKPITKTDKLYQNHPKVLYIVLNDFNISPLKEVREAYCICQDGDKALLYHPTTSTSRCGCFELVKRNKRYNGYWHSLLKESYVNCL